MTDEWIIDGPALRRSIAARYLASILFEVKPADFVTYVSVSLLLAIVATAACYVPARRALKVSPTVALREQ